MATAISHVYTPVHEEDILIFFFLPMKLSSRDFWPRPNLTTTSIGIII